MTVEPFAAPQTTSNARMRSPTNIPSMRGREKLFSMTPSNVPYPLIGIALVGLPNAVIRPASRRSLSCQSALLTWNGMRVLSPYAVLPSNSTYVLGVAKRLEPLSTTSGPKEYVIKAEVGTGSPGCGLTDRPHALPGRGV